MQIDSHANNFHLLRLIAATLVIVHHSYELLGIHYDWFSALTGMDNFGGLAVRSFFIISGFLITASLLRAPSIPKYLLNRVLRIFPALAVVVILAVFVLGPLLTRLPLGEYFTNPQTWAYLKNLYLIDLQFALPGVFTTNPALPAVNGSFWTLPFEFIVYLVLAMLFVLGVLRLNVVLFLVLLLFALDQRLVQYFGLQGAFLSMPYQYIGSFWGAFFLGSLVYLLKERFPLQRNVFYFLLGLAVVSTHTAGAKVVYFFALPYIIIYLAYAYFPPGAWLNRFGDISYGTYLYAFPVQQTILYFTGKSLHPLEFLALAAPITWLLAYLSWTWVERPALRLKDTFFSYRS
jgi:peptidoglycan/LPS O-acetylase OafA/YrhL